MKQGGHYHFLMNTSAKNNLMKFCSDQRKAMKEKYQQTGGQLELREWTIETVSKFDKHVKDTAEADKAMEEYARSLA